MTNKIYNRRGFIKFSFTGLFAAIATLWGTMVYKQKKINSRKVITVPFNRNKEVDFYEDFIIINNGENTSVLSSRCTHLGCKINHHQNSELLCPCHGSSFTMEGNVTKGPAIRPLDKLDFSISEAGDYISITV